MVLADGHHLYRRILECSIRTHVGDNLRTRQTMFLRAFGFDDGQIVRTALSAPIANTLEAKTFAIPCALGQHPAYLPSCGRA
jgi:hypothetical protein